jgi:hypothetical protein
MMTMQLKHNPNLTRAHKLAIAPGDVVALNIQRVHFERPLDPALHLAQRGQPHF